MILASLRSTTETPREKFIVICVFLLAAVSAFLVFQSGRIWVPYCVTRLMIRNHQKHGRVQEEDKEVYEEEDDDGQIDDDEYESSVEDRRGDYDYEEEEDGDCNEDEDDAASGSVIEEEEDDSSCDYSDDEDEGEAGYKPGGYHPVKVSNAIVMGGRGIGIDWF